MILKSLRQIGRHSFVYSIKYVVSNLACILLLPVYTRYLTKADYGTLSLIDQSIYYMQIVFFLGSAAAVARFYHYFEGERDKRLVVSTGVWLALCSSFCGGAVLFAGCKPLSKMIFGAPGYDHLIYLAVLIMMSEALISVAMSYYAAVKDSTRYVVYGLSQLALGIVCNLFFIISLRLGAVGMVYGQALSNSIFALLVTAHVVKVNRFGFDREIFVKIVRFGLPLVPATILAAIMHSADQYLIRHYSGLEAVGIYSLGYKIAFAANSVFTVSVNLIWSSALIFEIHRQPDAPRIYARMTTYLMSALVTLMLLVSVFAEQIVAILAAPEYHDSYRVIPLVCLGLIPYALNAFLSIGVTIYNKTWLTPISNGIAAVVNVLLNILLIPRYGYLGAACVTVATYAVFACSAWLLYRRVYAIPFEWSRLGTVTGICVVLYLASVMLPIGNLLLLTLCRALLCLSLPVILYLVNFFSPEERTRIFQWRAGLMYGIRKGEG